MILKRLGQLWKSFLDYYWVLEPVRFSAIVVGLAGVAFILVPQGEDILCGLSGSSHLNHMDKGRIAWFFIGLIYLCLSNWYWSRFLLNCDFQDQAKVDNTTKKFKDKKDILRLRVPRWLGVLPAILLGIGFLVAGQAEVNFCLAGVCFGLAILLYCGFILRRSLLNEALPGATPQKKQTRGGVRYASLHHLAADKPALAGLATFLVPSFLLGVFFTRWPVHFGLTMGSACVLFSAFASWSCYGALVVYFGHRYRLPVLSALMVLALIATCNNDNHDVRQITGAQSAPQARDNLRTSLDSWHARMINDYPQEASHPLFIVTAEGGGIRAGYWSALVLANLQDSARSNGPHGFSDHLFAISGVSGGSLGAATFVSLLTKPGVTNYTASVEKMLDQEFLAPLVGKMLFPDLFQRFVPWPFQCLDRAPALEEGWEHSQGKRSDLNDCFTNSFTALYKHAALTNIYLPALFLNGTEVESGRRIITSSLVFNDAARTNCLNTIDGLEKMNGADIRLSTAVHNSARFTYFSPAGRYPDGSHVVDGGYFENSGAETAHDILNAVANELAQKGWTDVTPVIITILNDPIKPTTDPKAISWFHPNHEISAPITALFNTRTSRSDLSFARLQVAAQVTNADYIPFGLVDRDVVIPLGWTLSNEATTEMNRQLTNSLTINSNLLSSQRVLRWLKPN